MSINSKTSISFQTEEINPGKTFYFSLQPNNQLVKLGDGSFGVVFQGYDDGSNIYAIKLLYTVPETPIARSRFEAEITSARDIRENLEDPNQLVGVIEIVGGTRQFRQSQAYETLKHLFEPLRISDYALVMPKYDGTLKDLLEKGIGVYTVEPNESISKVFGAKELIGSLTEVKEKIDQISTEENKQPLQEKIYELIGYDILKRMNFEQRIADILPYLEDIAEGLQTLHRAGYLHLDLKPANIFVKKLRQNINSVIGDLGFLEQRKSASTFMPGIYENLPLGTRHYRSPEQKDYFDIADVEISADEDRTLVIRDPKFRDTIIEQNDYVAFSKNPKKIYVIQSIAIDEDKENSPLYVKLFLNPDSKESLQPDRRTQAIFYNRQKERTDLFGFGALAFDLLTCGESPERFYESIRGYDTKYTNVDEIIELYQKVANFQSAEPGLVQIFEPFKLHKNSTSYAPVEVVELILKCLLYKAENTFYYSSLRERKEPLDILVESLYALHGENGRFYFKRLKNRLCFQEIEDSLSLVQNVFIGNLEQLQNLKKEKLPLRFAEGLWYLKRLAELVSGVVVSTTSDFYFAELHPQNIIIDSSDYRGDIQFKFVVYKNQESYEKDLRGDFVFTKIMREFGNPYVPDFFANIRRDINLKPKGSNHQQSLEYYYYFLDTYEPKIEPGDWIVLKLSNRTKNILWQVVSVDLKTQSVQIKLIPSSSNLENQEEHIPFELQSDEQVLKCVYYKNINSTSYYLYLMGIYIYQIFFANLEPNNNQYTTTALLKLVYTYFYFIKNGKALPEIMSLSKESKSKNSNLVGKLFGKGEKNNPKDENLEKLHNVIDLLIVMYLKLTLTECDESYYNKSQENSSRIFSLKDDLNELQKRIANFLSCETSALDTLKSNPNNTPNLSNLIDEDKLGDLLKFDQLIFTHLKLSSEHQWTYEDSLVANFWVGSF